jgi:hypothetical protein
LFGPLLLRVGERGLFLDRTAVSLRAVAQAEKE